MKKKKGYALLMSIVVVSMLIIMAMAISILASSAYLSTKRVQRSNKLKLVAESGIDKGMIVLKNYILQNSSYVDPNNIHNTTNFYISKFNPKDINNDPASMAELTFTNTDITCTITFTPDLASPETAANPYTHQDASTSRAVPYIKIVAKAQENYGSRAIKTISIVLDRSELLNIYFNQLFGSSLTTMDAQGTGTVNSVISSSSPGLDIAGNIHLQGDAVELKTSSFIVDEGKVEVLSSPNKFTWDDNRPNTSVADPLTGTDVRTSKSDGNTTMNRWLNSPVRPLKVLDILVPPDPASYIGPIHDYDAGNVIPVADIVAQQKLDPLSGRAYKDPITGNPLVPSLVTYKGKTAPGHSINFRNIIDGTTFNGADNGIYATIMGMLMGRGMTAPQAVDAYGTFYKLLLIDGDLVIPDNSLSVPHENFNNYIIYCTGKVTFEGEADFYNCSIMSKQLSFTSGKTVHFYGPGTARALEKIPGKVEVANFNDIDKMIINRYLSQNLKDYGEYINYKILQWK